MTPRRFQDHRKHDNLALTTPSISHKLESGIACKLELIEDTNILTVMEIFDVHKQNILSDLIEQGAHESALELLKGDHHFSGDELNKALISACQHEFKVIVQTLIQLGANVNSRDTNGNTPLLISVLNGMTDNVQFLLANKADVNASNFVGDSALILSIRSSRSIEITENLLKQPGINIDHQNQDGYTAIMTAAEVKNVNTLKIFLDKYCNIQNIATSSQCYEPTDECKTHKHASNNVSDDVYHLTTLGETVNCKGENVYQIAEKCGIGNVFNLLQQHISTKISPLELAMRANDIKSFNVFLDCDFQYTPGRKIQLDEVFLNIFQKFNDRCVTQFTEIEIAMIKALLEHGADVNSTWRDHHRRQVRSHKLERLFSKAVSLQRPFLCKSKRDPIQIAAKIGCVKVLELLLSFKVNVNRYDFCKSPLHIALSHDHTECARLLIQHGANIDFNRALELAVNQQKPKYVRFLIENYGESIMEYMNTSIIDHILLLSVRKGNLEIVGHILDLGANINGRIGFPNCLLAESKNGEVAKFLIDMGAKVNMGEINCTPLIKVLYDKDIYGNSVVEVIQVLLENGASVNDRSWCGKTALMLAAGKKGSVRVLQLLLDHDAELSETDRNGNTALMHATVKGCSQNFLLLLQFIQDRKHLLNVQTTSGFTALMYAVLIRNKLIIKSLIAQGADVNIKDSDGNTVLLHLLLTTYRYDGDILRSLIQAGCDVNCQNDEGISPLMVAAENCLKDAISVLLDSGASINAVSKRDNTETALTHLLKRPHLLFGHFSCFEYLLDRGAISSYVDANTFHKMIVTGQIQVVAKLIRCGFGPVGISQSNLIPLIRVCDPRYFVYTMFFSYSPLFTALWVGNSVLAHFFVGNLFLIKSDMSLLGNNKLLRHHLKIKNYKECLDIFHEISTQPMTLFSLSFVAVSTAVGTAPDREIRVNELPLPQIFKEKLLFKSNDVVLTVPEKNITGFSL